MSEAIQLDGMIVVMATVAFVAVLHFLQRYLASRGTRRPPAELTGVQERLERIESIVEATAVEVERISEANRFMSRLLADPSTAVPSKSKSERVITPH